MTIRGVQQFIPLEPELLYVARLDGGIPKGITGTVAAGSSAGFRRFIGVTDFTENLPTAETVEIPGDGGVVAQYNRQASGVITIAQNTAIFDQIIISELTDKTIYTEGAWKIGQRTRRCQTFKDLAFIISGRAISQEAGSVGEEGWWTKFYWNGQGKELGYALTIGSAVGTGVELSVNESDTTWWEEDLNTNYDQSYAWSTDYIVADYPIMVDYYQGDGTSVQTVTLSQTPAAADGNSVQAWEDGTKKTYTTDYAVSGTTLTYTDPAGDPANASDNIIAYEYQVQC